MKKTCSLILSFVLFAGIISACANATVTETIPEELVTTTPRPVTEQSESQTDPNEPVVITGTIPYTSPFFVNSIAEPFVLLEDQAGFVARDLDFEFPLQGQTIGPVEQVEDGLLAFTLPLPIAPRGTMMDLDNDAEQDAGVMVFQIAYWSNTWGGPFLEKRDGTGWSSAYTAAITDADREYEISGGTILIWAPDHDQSFPSGFGDDNMLFTDDDPITSVPAGYSLVDLDARPFRIYKERAPELVLLEGEGAVNDYSDMSYVDAFDALFSKASMEYPFTVEKNVDWDALYIVYHERAAAADTDLAFYHAIHDFMLEIPDGHIGGTLDPDDFYHQAGGSFGMLLREISDGRVIVTDIILGTPADSAGIQTGAEIISWDGQPITDAIGQIEPYFGPYSTDHHKRVNQLLFLTRYPVGTSVAIEYKNPKSTARTIELMTVVEYDSLIAAIPAWSINEMSLPIEGEILEEYGLGYIQITTFSSDDNLMARLWEYYLTALNDTETPGLILDLRVNGGGNGGLAADFAGYFFDEEFEISHRLYYNELSGE